jgi:peptidoglycan/LPS O-acetylase OafA/YrhL
MFLVGTLLHRGFERLRPWLAGRGLWWLGAYALACWLGGRLGWRVGTNLPHPFLAVVLGITTISLAYTLPNLASRVLRGNDLSYGIYITHMPVFNALLAVGLSGSPEWMLAGSVLVVGLAWLSWCLVERPFLAKRQG